MAYAQPQAYGAYQEVAGAYAQYHQSAPVPAAALPEPGEIVEEGQTVTMVVPEGSPPGSKLKYTAPDGQELRLTVPDGVPAGSVMTLTQDPKTGAWKCMAEPQDEDPAFAPAPEPAPLPQQEVQREMQYVPPAYAERFAGASNMLHQFGNPSAQTYTAAALTSYPAYNDAPIVQRHHPSAPYAQPLPVNLSYVPPPQGQNGMMYAQPPASLGGDPALYNPPRQMPTVFGGEGGFVYEQRPSYTPPPFVVDQRPSYTPPPQVTYMEQRPSYTPLPQVLPGAMQPLMGTTARQTATDRYAPPSVLMQNNPSYVPPAQIGETYVAQAPSSVQLQPQQPSYLQPQTPYMGSMPQVGFSQYSPPTYGGFSGFGTSTGPIMAQAMPQVLGSAGRYSGMPQMYQSAAPQMYQAQPAYPGYVR